MNPKPDTLGSLKLKPQILKPLAGKGQPFFGALLEGAWVWDLGFRVRKSLGFRVQGLGF